jgi:hypothetical protein
VTRVPRAALVPRPPRVSCAAWNGGGSVQAPYNASKRTCDGPGKGSLSGEPRQCNKKKCNNGNCNCNYCYRSCMQRSGGCHPCDWTTCNDDIQFVSDLLDWLEAQLCVDTGACVTMAAGCWGGCPCRQMANGCRRLRLLRRRRVTEAAALPGRRSCVRDGVLERGHLHLRGRRGAGVQNSQDCAAEWLPHGRVCDPARQRAPRGGAGYHRHTRHPGHHLPS